MRTLVDIRDDQISALDALSKRRQTSRAAIIRAAITEYVARHGRPESDAFGLWGDRKTDGLAYQEKVRAEW